MALIAPGIICHRLNNYFLNFQVLPIVVFFSAFTYVLYYLGVIVVAIKKISWLLTITMGTSPAESFNAAGNIFVGMVIRTL